MEWLRIDSSNIEEILPVVTSQERPKFLEGTQRIVLTTQIDEIAPVVGLSTEEADRLQMNFDQAPTSPGDLHLLKEMHVWAPLSQSLDFADALIRSGFA